MASAPAVPDTSAATWRRLVQHELRQPVLENSSIAQYLATIYREQPSASDLSGLNLQRLQWAWNFAPFNVECLYVRNLTTSKQRHAAELRQKYAVTNNAPVNPASEVVCSPTAESGAVRIAQTMGLALFDVYGYGIPAPLHSGRCSGDGAMQHRSSDVSAVHGGLFDVRDGLVEVLRISVLNFTRATKIKNASALSREGGPNGCWYIPLRGTGIFLEMGRTLQVPNRSLLVRALGISKQMVADAAKIAPNPRKLRGQFLHDLWSMGIAGSYRVRSIEDYVPFCPYVRARGYDTVVIGSSRGPEVLSCSDSCTRAYLQGACAPNLRTGLRGTRACACDDRYPIVNCAARPSRLATLSGVPPFPRLHLEGRERGPALQLPPLPPGANVLARRYYDTFPGLATNKFSAAFGHRGRSVPACRSAWS